MSIVLSAATILAALALVLQPVGSMEVFYATAAIIAGLIATAVARPTAGWFGASALLGWFALMIVQPFSITTRQLNALSRAARNGNEEASALLAFYERLAPWSWWIMVGLTLGIVTIYLWGLRRARSDRHDFLMAESDALASLASRAGIVAAMAFVPMMLIIVYDVVQRKYLGWNPAFTETAWYRTFTSTKIQEMQWHLHAILFLMCFGYAYVQDAHVRIELVREALRPRTRIWIELAGTLLFMLPYCYVVIQYGIDFAMRAYAMNERSSAQTGLDHRFIIKAFLPLGFIFLAIAAMSVAQKCVVYLFGPEHLRARASTYAGTLPQGAGR
jgi:TRAP-type mannitol/chloroaromatic compound transport system permease small subunit